MPILGSVLFMAVEFNQIGEEEKTQIALDSKYISLQKIKTQCQTF